jgi:hypothetical protein
MHVKILPRPVMGLYRIDGNMFIRQQRRQVFACRAADGKDGVALPPRKVMARATLIAAAGFKHGALQRSLPSG